MDKPTVDEVLEGLSAAREADIEEPNRYTAVMVTAKRARQINSYYHSLGEGGGLDTLHASAGGQLHQELPEHRHGRSGQRRDRIQDTSQSARRSTRRKERVMADQPVVLLGVTGGIAAYKAAELLRGLQKAGMDVRVVMTRAATRFVGPMTFETLSAHPVRLDEISELTHRFRASLTSTTAQQADIMVVAPATANTLAKMANGIADNLLSSMYLAFAKTVVVAPAMNTNMWEHPATQRNVLFLRERGVFVVEPGAGELACGDYGSGPHGRSRQHRGRSQITAPGAAQARPARHAGGDHRRRHARAHRCGALHRQPQFRQDGLRSGPGRLRPGRSRGTHPGERGHAGRAGCAAGRGAYRRGDACRSHEAAPRYRHPHHGGRSGRLSGGRRSGRRQGRQRPRRVVHRPGGHSRHPLRRGGAPHGASSWWASRRSTGWKAWAGRGARWSARSST